ncbi:MAG TPA: NAD-dependent epimerase/dehydratase family protein [Verrucomicrobiales bacterium]|nr:NAD-dependent epimerase/dehydratase family protein [Verrucomicrobiales bacterium]
MRVLVAGAGYLGEKLADDLSSRGDAVTALTGSEASAKRLRESGKGYPVLAADLGDVASLRAVLSQCEGSFDAAVHCASSGRGGPEVYGRVYGEGCRNLSSLLPEARLLFTSSTSVYAQSDGGWVDEQSPATPLRETGRILREAENFVVAQGGMVARVAGIYGPGRSIILQKFFEDSAAIEGEGGRFVNQAHRDDIVSAYLLLLDSSREAPPAPALVNVVDSQPQSQRDLYTWLAQRFCRPVPPRVAPDLERKRGWTHKRVSNARLRALGWTPRYPSFQDAVLGDPDLLSAAMQATAVDGE